MKIRSLQKQRAWYYTRIFADSQDEETVYVLNVSYHLNPQMVEDFKGRQNASSLAIIMTYGVDPQNNQRMIIADDGGAQVFRGWRD